MRRWMSKLFALLLTAVMLLGVMPTLAFGTDAETNEKNADPIHVYTDEENALLDNGVFAEIEAVKNTAATRRGGAGNLTEADYAAVVPQVAAAVMKSDTYVPGTLQKRGNLLVWQTTVGIPCCYSPRMEAKLAENAIPGADPEALADTVVTSFATRGGSPASIDVAVFQPYYGSDGSFTTQYADEGKSIAQVTGGTNTTYIGSNATIDNIAHAIETCGVVIFDSHGTTDYESGNDYTSKANSSYLCLTTSTGITSQDTAAQTGPYGTYYHCIKGYGYAYVDGTCMTNHMTGQSPNGIVWMAICLGMATDGLEAPLHNRGAEVVYGYSQSVSFAGDYKYEEYFWGKMKDGAEVNEAAAYMKQKVGIKDPYTNPPAYPIFVSSEDPYPGHGNVDKAQEVYSTWTLFAQYEITALSNNTAWGTVSLSGRTITATPATGYYIAGYEVTSGTATVTQSGNTFKVQAETDCTVQINFAARTPAQVNFSVPEGVTCGTISGYIDDVITLPSPQGAPLNNAIDFHFLGWTTEPLDGESSEAPTFLSAGETLKLTDPDLTFYALYGYFTDGEGAEGQFLKLSAAPEDWAGEYLITYNGSKLLNATLPEGSTASYMGTSKAVTAIDDTPIISIDYYLSLVPDELVFVIAPDATGAYPGSYTVKMKGEDRYLAVTTNSNSLSTKTAATDGATHWLLSVANGSPVMTNVGFPTRTLQFNPTAGVFRGYLAGAYQPITLYSAQEGSLWFTTDPNAISACEEHVFGDWTVETEPTCTEPGVRCRVCQQCGLKEREEIPALGHDFVDGVCTRCGAVDPAPVLTLTGVASTGKTKLTWTAVDGAESYNVYRAFSADGEFSLLQNTTELSFTHTGGKAGKTYSYRVAAVYSDRVGAMSEAKARTCDLPQPVVSRGHDAVTGKNKLTWKAIDGAVKYRVYRAFESDGEFTLLTTTTDLSFIHTGGKAGKTYYYKVMAVAANVEANSACSQISVLTCDLPRPEVSITLSGGGNPKLIWNAVDGAVHYRIYRAVSQNGEFTLYHTTDKLTFINSNVEKGKTYYYKVMAVAENSEANSAFSAVVSIKAGK